MHFKAAEVVNAGSGPHTWKASWAALGASVVALLLIGALASSAQAAFTAPVSLSAIDASGPKATIDANGNAIAVWSQYDGQKWRIEERQISPAGALGPVETLSAASENPLWPQIAGDPRGGAIVAWPQPNSTESNTLIKAQRISATGRLGALKTISAPRRPARNPRIASDASGDAAVVWEQSPRRRIWNIEAREISSKGSLGRVKTLSSARHKSGGPAIAMDSRGAAITVWSQLAPNGKSSRVKARRISPEGRLGSVMTVSARRNAIVPQVASDARGNAVVTWEVAADKYSNWRIKARRISSTGNLGQVETLYAGWAAQPQIASGASGAMTIVWEANPNTQPSNIQARQISAAGVIGPAQTLSSAAANSYTPEIAVDGAGNATVIWSETRYSTSHPDASYLRARQISATGALGPMQTLASEATRNFAIAVNSDGDAFADWTQLEGSYWRVWGSLGP
jgi:hypothetical protein